MPVPVMPSSLAGIARFPRARLGHAPTPLDPAPNLGAVLGIDLWIKRDDCTGFAFGGNKVRQLEFHFGEAEARGADTVLVTGRSRRRTSTCTARRHSGYRPTHEAHPAEKGHLAPAPEKRLEADTQPIKSVAHP